MEFTFKLFIILCVCSFVNDILNLTEDIQTFLNAIFNTWLSRPSDNQNAARNVNFSLFLNVVLFKGGSNFKCYLLHFSGDSQPLLLNNDQYHNNINKITKYEYSHIFMHDIERRVNFYGNCL